MAGQSITFDFLTTGADSTASGFRKVGDNAALASRGAKVLADVIKQLGDKEDRTAAESKILASALKQTGDAEDRMTAKTVLADAAIRRLDDSMQDSTKKSDGLQRSLSGLKLNPGFLGPALLLAPALASLTGVVAGAAAGLSGAFVAGGAALAAFGAVAKPVLTDAKTAANAVETAQNAYNAAIAGGTKQAVAYKAEQIAIAKAYAGMSPAQIALSKQLGTMADAWDAVKTAETPVVSGALQPWLKSVTALTGQLGPIIAKVAPVIASLGAQFGNLVNSPAFKAFRDFIGSTGSAAVSAGGSTIIDLVNAFIVLLPKFDPLIREAVGWIARLGPAVLTWASSKKASDDITKFMQWFSQNGPVVGGFLKSIGAALAALAPGLTSGAAVELKVVTDFLNFVARLPPTIAKPLAEVAGALLILQKTGVVTAGVKLVGLTGLSAPAAAAGGAIAAGIVFKIREDLQSGFKGIIRDIPGWFNFGSLGFIAQSAQGWADLIVSKVRHSLLSWEDDVRHHIANTFDGIRHDVSARWDGLMKDIAVMMDIAKENIRITWDKIEILFLRGVGSIINIMAKLPGPLGAPFRAAQKSIASDLARIQGDVRTATGNIQADWDRIHGKTVHVNFVGSGSGSIAFKESIPGVTLGPSSAGLLGFHAEGGMIRGGTPGRDSVLGMLMPGEVVVPTAMVRGGAVDHLRGKLPGFAAGGTVTGMGAADRIPAAGEPFMANAEAAFGRAVEGAFAKAVIAKFKKDMSALGGNGSAIVSYARSFLGKIPYVFGGNSLTSGIDCSGFTQAIYSRFGIHAPRTSESQYAWASKSAPVPGALAFYVSPAGGPPPGHVAIVQDASTVISQGGGMGPTLMGLHAMPLMGTGVPKGGLPAGAGVGNPAIGGSLQAIAHALLQQHGWDSQWPSFNALETREANWVLTARNPSSGAYGLAQFINGPSEYYQYGGNPNTGLGQLTAMMSYISQRYGDPVQAWDHESLFGWYARGGRVPGYAAGGSVTTGGPAATAAYRKMLASEQAHEGADYLGLRRAFLHGPAKYRTKSVMSGLETMFKKQGDEQVAYKHLAGAGLTAANLGKLGSAARAESSAALSGVLNKTPGGHPGWATGLRYWLGQLSGTAGKGLPGGQATSGPTGAGLPAITHQYGGDVTGTIGAFLSSVAAPFTGKALGGLVFDQGGTLRPGWNGPIFNGTGRPEQLVPARGGGGGTVRLEVSSGGSTEFDRFMEAWLRKHVKVKGGGSAQRAFGVH